MTDKPKPRQVAVIGHVHPSNPAALTRALIAGLEPYQRAALLGMSGPAQIAFAQSMGQIAEVVDMTNGTSITFHPAPADPDTIRGHELEFIAMDELTEAPAAPADPAGAPPRALSNNVTHRDFHPSYLRVGVRIDGVERNDIRWYDVAAGLASTTGGVMLKSEAIEPYWRYPESRQMRRARERWEGKRK